MSKFNLDLSQFKKIKSDKFSTTLKHSKHGHEIKLAHNALSKDMRKKIMDLPAQKLAEGGEADTNSTPLPDPYSFSDVQSDQPQYSRDTEEQEPSIGKKLENIIVPKKLIPAVDAYSNWRDNFVNKVSNSPAVQSFLSGQEVNEPQEKKPNPQNIQSHYGASESMQPNDMTLSNPSIQQANPDTYGMMGSFQGQINALNEQKAGQQMMAVAQGEAGKQSALAENQFQDTASKAAADYQNAHNELSNERQALQNDIANQHINPDKFIQNMSTGSKIGTALGLIMGGLGAGLTHGPNMAYQMLQNNIDRDIDAQKSELGKKQNLLSHNYQATQDLRAAYDLTRLQNNDILSSKLKQIAATTQNQASKGMALAIAGQFDAQSAQIQHQMAMNKMMMGGSGTSGGDDPARMVFAMNKMGIIPDSQVGEASKAAANYNRAKTLNDEISELYKRASEEKSSGNIIGESASRTALRNRLIELKTIEVGRGPNETELEALEKVIPTWKDSESRTREKYNDLMKEISNATAVPTSELRSRGIQIQPIEPGGFKIVNGIKYKRGPNGKAIRVN